MAGVTEFNNNSRETLIAKIRKRDGRIVHFEQSKISSAIYKALIATGKPDYPLADRLGAKVEQKMKILNKKDLDEVDKAFDLNSLRVLATRYLLRDSNNEILEGPKQMFERVATLVAIADIMHDSAIFTTTGGYTQNIEEADRYYGKLDDFDNKLHIGSYYLNKYHFEAMIRHYIYCAQQGQMKISFKDLLRMVAEGKMAHYEERVREYYNLMVSRDYLPNTPTLMNSGAKLGQLSACFVLDMPDDMAGIMKAST